MTRPRVLLSGHLPPPLGGIGTYCQTLLDSPLAEQVDLRFVQTSSQRRSLLESGSVSWRNLVEGVGDVGRFLRAYLAHRPGIVHLCTAQDLSFLKNSIYVALARLLGGRVLLNPHCGFDKLYRTNRIWQGFCRLVFRLTHGILVLSREWLALEKILPGARVRYLPNPVDTRPYRTMASERPPADPGPLHVLYLGYLGEAKGTFDLLEAFKALDTGGSEIVLHLVGGFMTLEDEGRLVQAVPSLAMPRKTCLLEPPVSGERKLACFRQAHVFVFPSHDEGMPMAILEAMASGLPVVATSVGGIPDLIVDGENGFLTAPRDPMALARSLEKLCSSPGLRLAMGSRNARQALDYDVRRYSQELLEIYAHVSAR